VEGRGELPFWYNKKLNLSTWDSPTLILTSLLSNNIESEDSMFVSCWEGIENTPFTKVKLIERDPKKKKRTVKYLYLHRITKQIFNENPLQPVKEEITQVK